MTIRSFQIIALVSFLTLACCRPSDRVTYNDLESMGASCPDARDKCRGYHNNLTYVDRNCECDSLCVYYDDCCADAPARMNSRRQSVGNNMICLNYGNMYHTGVYVVSSCSRSFQGSNVVREKCTGPPDWTDPLTSIPATDVAQAVTYRNLFCAECNNANMESLRNFNIRIACDSLVEEVTDEQILADITYNEETHSWGLYRLNSSRIPTFYECDMIFDVPGYLNHSVRFCRSDIVSTCAPNWHRESIRRACRDYMAAVHERSTDSTVMYRNPHCAICNYKTVDQISCTYGIDVISRGRPMSFALLLDVNQSDGDQVGMRRVTTPPCPSNQKYDPFFKKCRLLVCALPNHVVVNGRCVRV